MAKLQAHQVDSANPIGIISPFAGRTAPTGWLLCYGQTVSRTTYASLFSVIVPTIGTFTVTIATPAVVTMTAHGFVTGDQVYFTTTGALPTGLTANTIYYVVYVGANSFNVATTRANAVAGTKIATSGTQSGTHSLYSCDYGLGDGSTTFTLPDLRGRVLAGADAMGGTAAARLSLAQSQGSYGNRGASGGEQGHAQTSTELATHGHTFKYPAAGSGGGLNDLYGIPYNLSANASIVSEGSPPPTTGQTRSGVLTAGSGTASNVVQPTLVTNYIIKAV